MKVIANSTTIWLLGLTAVTAALRFFSLGERSLWADEMATWLYSYAPSFTAWREGFYASPEPFPGGYYMFMHFFMRIAGESEFALRLPSAIAAVATVPAIFLLGRRLAGEHIGLGAAALVTFNYKAIVLAQTARPYALIFLFSAVLGYSLLGRSRRDHALFLISGIVLTQLHYFGVLLFGLAWMWVLYDCLRQRHKPPPMLWMAALICFLLFLPWLQRFLEHLSYSEINKNIKNKDLWHMARNFMRYAFFEDAGPDTIVGKGTYWLAVIGLAASLNLRQWSSRWLWIWVAVPFLALWLKSTLSQPSYRARYLVIVLPAVFVLLSIGLDRLSLGRRKTYSSLIALLCFGLLFHVYVEQGYHARAFAPNLRRAFLQADTKNDIWTCFSRADYALYFARQQPSLMAHWPRREKCNRAEDLQITPPSEKKCVNLLFDFAVDVGDLEGRMRAAGWEMKSRDLEANHAAFEFCPSL